MRRIIGVSPTDIYRYGHDRQIESHTSPCFQSMFDYQFWCAGPSPCTMPVYIFSQHSSLRVNGRLQCAGDSWRGEAQGWHLSRLRNHDHQHNCQHNHHHIHPSHLNIPCMPQHLITHICLWWKPIPPKTLAGPYCPMGSQLISTNPGNHLHPHHLHHHLTHQSCLYTPSHHRMARHRVHPHRHHHRTPHRGPHH